jgi:ribosome recycling factor
MDDWNTNFSSILDKTNSLLTTPVYVPDKRALYISPYENGLQSDAVLSLQESFAHREDVAQLRDELEQLQKSVQKMRREVMSDFEARTNFVMKTMKIDMSSHLEAMKVDRNGTNNY